MALTVDEQYKLLRLRLDQLEYRDTFSIDSMTMVQRLLGDLIQTTETCQRLKVKVEEVAGDKKHISEQVSKDQCIFIFYGRHLTILLKKIEPLRHEIARLTSETNQLHLGLIQSQDEKDIHQKKLLLVVRNYESQIDDLKFMNSQYLIKISMEQKRTEVEKSKVQELFQKQGLIDKDGKGTILFRRHDSMRIKPGPFSN